MSRTRYKRTESYVVDYEDSKFRTGYTGGGYDAIVTVLDLLDERMSLRFTPSEWGESKDSVIVSFVPERLKSFPEYLHIGPHHVIWATEVTYDDAVLDDPRDVIIWLRFMNRHCVLRFTLEDWRNFRKALSAHDMPPLSPLQVAPFGARYSKELKRRRSKAKRTCKPPLNASPGGV